MKLKNKLVLLMILPMALILVVLSTIGNFAVRKTIYGDIEKGMKSTAASLLVSYSENIDVEYLEDSLSMIKEYRMIITDKSGNILASTLLNSSGEAVDSSLLNVDYSGAYQFIKKQRIDGVDYTFLVYPGRDISIVVLMNYDDAIHSASSIVYWIFLSIFLTMIVCIVVDMVLVNSITKRLNVLVDVLDRMAEGDLKFKPDRNIQKRKDETGKLMRAILNLRGQMREVIGAIVEQGEAVVDAATQINDEASQTSNAIGQIDSAVVDISDGATSQANETQNATDNVKIIGDMIAQTKGEIENLDFEAENMKIAGDEASETLIRLKQINGKTKGAIDVIFAQTNTTNESALRIQEATDMITNIAEETNLLSLNASIEAARAGEQGKGFAVVANQIQKLAEQSDESARVIAEIVTNLLAESDKAVTSMNEVKTIIEEQDEMVETTDKAFEKVRVGIEETRNSVRSIEDKAIKLDEARGNVIDIVSSLTAIAQENAASTQQTSASVTEVTAIVSDISDNSEIMKKCANNLMEKTSVFTL